MTITDRRHFVSPLPDEDWDAIAARALPDDARAAAVAKLKSWNLHLFTRLPPGRILGCDVIFVEPPRPRDGAGG
jgi:hypothetical protein